MRILLTFLLIAILVSVGHAEAQAPARIPLALLFDEALSPPVKHALGDLERALLAKNYQFVAGLPNAAGAVAIGTAASKTFSDLLRTEKIELAKPPESLAIRKLAGEKPGLVLAGRDQRGLAYAIRETTRAIETAPSPSPPRGEGKGGQYPFAAVRDISEEPFLRVRSMTMHLFNEDLESPWYFDENFWRDYFAMLGGYRFNQFTLTFGDQTNYLNPICAYLLDVPGYKVQVKGLAPEAKKRNLQALRRISELAREYGVDFSLGIWMQLPEPRYAGPVLVEGLPPGLAAAAYCAEGLKMLLQACPAITRVQLRMNAEAGVPEEQQTDFFRPIFQAIRFCGRHIQLDLRYKGLRTSTLQAALDLGLDVTVSTKFWCEHMGLPYHPTEEDTHYRESRYGYGAMLAYPSHTPSSSPPGGEGRGYKVMYRLWTAGTQRVFLWGDPFYAARFAQSCRLGDGEGFEVFAPLTNRGYGNAPLGPWSLFADPAARYCIWDHQRYWAFYLAFGRMGYNPNTPPAVWGREFEHRFGPAADDIQLAYLHASKVLPLITATHLPSASEWSWWPEMDTGDGLAEYMHTQPSDRGQFYAIRSWKKTPAWRCEPWDDFVPGYVEDAVAGTLRGKWTPIMVSRRLHELADSVLKNLGQAKKLTDGSAPSPPTPLPGVAGRGENALRELRATEIDLQILAHLARYHAEKKLAATHLAFFDITKEGGRLPVALAHNWKAADAWRQIVRLTEGFYSDRLVFGTSPENLRNNFGHHHSGHWQDRLKQIEADVAALERLAAKEGSTEKFRTFPGETPLDFRSEIQHEPVLKAVPGADLPITLRVESKQPLRKVILHYRTVNQTADWHEVAMQPVGDKRLQAVIPAGEITPRWDMMYHFELLVDGGGTLWPSWELGQPYVVVSVDRPAK